MEDFKTRPALEVANKFIELALEDKVPIGIIKLMKLVYIAHGVHLARHNSPLVLEEVEAWLYGETIPSIYYAFRHFGKEPVEKPEFPISDGKNSSGYIYLEIEKRIVIYHVWRLYKAYTTATMVGMSLAKDTPYYQVWENEGGKHRWSAIIRNDLIKPYFAKRLAY